MLVSTGLVEKCWISLISLPATISSSGFVSFAGKFRFSQGSGWVVFWLEIVVKYHHPVWKCCLKPECLCWGPQKENFAISLAS